MARGIHGVRCFRARLGHRLTQVGLPHTPALLWAAYRVDVLGEPPERAAPTLGAIPGLARLRLDGPWPADPVARLAARRSLPTWVARTWLDHFGEAEADALAGALNVAGPITVRANRARTDRIALAAALRATGIETRPGRWSADSLHFDTRGDIRGHPAWVRGDFEVQDEGSQLIAAAVAAAPGETVLDLCAGSGGKTLALAAAMQDRGRVIATEVAEARLADLRGRVRQRALRSVTVLRLAEDRALGEGLPTAVDRVLVDAPCSALGTWRRGPDRRWRIPRAEADAFVPVQARLLREAAAVVRPGGRVVYATCTLRPEENQARIAAAADGLVPAPVLPGVFDAPWVELRPDVHGTDGFFVAAFVRR